MLLKSKTRLLATTNSRVQKAMLLIKQLGPVSNLDMDAAPNWFSLDLQVGEHNGLDFKDCYSLQKVATIKF